MKTQLQTSKTNFSIVFKYTNTPVPNGTIATAGEEHCESCPTLSKHCNTQPIVPSPPQTSIL